MARNNSRPPAGQPSPPLSPELLERFLELQRQELQVRAEDVHLRAKMDDNNKAISEKAIAAQLEDRERERGHIERKTKLIFIGSTIIFLVITIFAAFALYSGHADLVQKIAETFAVFIAGFVGGYGFKAARSHHQNQADKSDD